MSFSRTATKDVWSVFSDFPSQADPMTGNVHLFPYQGDMFPAGAKSVWFKGHRKQDDPTVREQALHNWLKLYENHWTFVSGDCLPASNLVDVVPHAKLSADHWIMQFRLVILIADGSLKVFAGDIISSGMKFDDLKFDSGTGPFTTVPKWSRITYHSDLINGCDGKDNTWDITPNFEKSSYSIANRSHHNARFTEFTATDAGLIVVKAG